VYKSAMEQALEELEELKLVRLILNTITMVDPS
jgi:hypothetical protein